MRTRACVHVYVCAQLRVCVFSPPTVVQKIQFDPVHPESQFRSFLKRGSLGIPVLAARVCLCARRHPPPLLQTNRMNEEADNASGAATAPADDEVCLQCAVPVRVRFG